MIASKERILDAAERLFAEQGFAATSLRRITGQAGVNLASVNYHFGSKEELIEAVFARRVGPLNRERLELLAACEAASGDAPPPVEEILAAFVGPALRLSRDSSRGGEFFQRLLGRAHVEPPEQARNLLRDQFGETLGRFVAALARALPGLPETELRWRMQFVVGALGHTLATGRCRPPEAEDSSRTSESEAIVDRLVCFLAAGMRVETTPRRTHRSTRGGAAARSALALALLLALGGRSPARAEESPLTLESAVKLALTHNERAGAADDRAAAAAARVGKARAYFLPALSLGGIYTRRPYATTRKVGDGTVTLQQRDALQGTASFGMTLFDARSIPLYRQAARDRDAAFLQSAEDKRLLGFEAAGAFLATLSFDQVQVAAERRLEFARKNLEDARARYEAQLVSSNDVTRAQLELATAERERARAQGEMQTACLQLGFLLDAPVEGGLAPPDSLLAAAVVPPADPSALGRAARARRLDVAASRRRAAALHASAQEPLLRYLPSFSLSGTSRTTNEGGLNGRTNDWSVGVNLGWALYDGGVRGADRDERLALAAAADLDTRARSRKIDVEVQSALVALSTAQAAIQQATVAVDVARQNAAETSELYRQGLARALEVADAGVRLFEAEVALARERFGLGLAYLDLRAALGLDPLGKEPTT